MLDVLATTLLKGQATSMNFRFLSTNKQLLLSGSLGINLMKLASLSRVAMGVQSAIETQVMSSWTILSSVHSALTAPIANMLPSKYVSTIRAATDGKVLFWLSNRMGCSSKLELYSPVGISMGRVP